jgi:hypothetical protein
MRDRGGIGRHAGLRSQWAKACGGSSPLDRTTFSDTPSYWGLRFSKDENWDRKRLACHWIEVLHKEPELADKIRNDRLLESDLFRARKHCREIVAVRSREMILYRATANV